jgi:hypothetical protein
VSTLAKIFVVINFALAVAFLVFTLTVYSKRVKYAERVKAAQDETVKVTAEKTKMEADYKTKLDKSEVDRKAAESKATERENDARKLAADMEAIQKKEADARNTANAVSAQNAVLLEQVQKMRAELEEGRKTVMALKENNVRLQMDTDEYKKQLVDAQNDNNTLKNNIEDLHKDRKRLAEDLANADYVMKEAIKAGFKLPVVPSIPDVRTKVVDVRNTGNVALGAGSDSGIKEGTIFLIHRGDELIGKVRVTTVWNDFSGGQVIEQKKPIKAGDEAMSSRGS